jgi:hypothetical protein
MAKSRSPLVGLETARRRQSFDVVVVDLPAKD